MIHDTIIILDRSGSMCNEVSRITSKILPMFLKKLNYEDNDRISMIMFEKSSVMINDTIENIFSKNYKSMGATNFH